MKGAIGNTHLRNLELWRDFSFATGTMHVVVGMDGAEHLRMRKLQAKAYSPKLIEAKLDDFLDITRCSIAEWPHDRPIETQKAMQGIVAEQMGRSLTGVSPGEHLDDLTFFLEALLRIHVLQQWPKLAEFWPRFRRARRGVKKLYAKILDMHRPENRNGKPSDFIDELLEMNREDPQFLPETDYMMSFLGPYFVSLDTAASTCSYMLYALLKQPDLLAQVRAEADSAFSQGTPTVKDLQALDVMRRVLLETLRMYPVTPAVMRIAANSFEFGGFRVPAGTQILVGTSVGHRLPECFPDPERFDIERYRRVPPEHRQPGAYAPFGLGRHRCLGSGFAEVQIILTLATIVHELDLEFERPDLPLRTRYTPTCHPDASFRFRVTNKRRHTV